jgi:hypothetical protein
VLDGEIVHLDTDGKPQFYDLLRRRTPQQFVAFDLLWLDGRDLRSLPLVERKRQLRAIVPARSSALLYCDHIATRGVELFERVCGLDLEGIVAKRKDGLYTPEETSWVKIKNPAYSEVEGRANCSRRECGRLQFENPWHLAHPFGCMNSPFVDPKHTLYRVNGVCARTAIVSFGCCD